jgi:hypothetical protein
LRKDKLLTQSLRAASAAMQVIISTAAKVLCFMIGLATAPLSSRIFPFDYFLLEKNK